jgi:Icc-related predicted phosphoesterase
MAIKGRKTKFIWLVSAVVFLSLSAFSGFAIQFHRDYQNIPSDHLIGNKASNAKALKEKGLPFSFLVMSDTHNSNTGEDLLKAAIMKEDISFVIHIGDFVNGPNLWEHRFFLMNMSVEIKPSFPIFLAPGNHDIDYIPSNRRQNGQRVTPEIFESLYGARNFSFFFNDCLFILCEIDPRNTTGYLHYLHETLSQKGMGRRYIFIFIHYPPERLVKHKGGGPLPDEEEFFRLVESYKVTACFFGHYHGYRRMYTKGMQMVVLGGGGGRLKSWQSDWGKFHHLLRINVNKNLITEDMIAYPGEAWNFRRTFKKWTFVHLFPITEDQVWILYVGLIFFLFWGIYSVKIFFCYKEKKTEESH